MKRTGLGDRDLISSGESKMSPREVITFSLEKNLLDKEEKYFLVSFSSQFYCAAC